MNYNIESIELMYTPITKQLLINYCKLNYEENADLSDESLMLELLWLYKNNNLDELFLAEFIASESRLETEFNIETLNKKSNYKPIIEAKLTSLLKFKADGIDGLEYDNLQKVYYLTPSNNGQYIIEIPSKHVRI